MCRRKHFNHLFCMAVWRRRQNAAGLIYLLLLSVLLPKDSTEQNSGGGGGGGAAGSHVTPLMKIEPSSLKLQTINHTLSDVQLTCGTPTLTDERVKSLIRLTIDRRLEETRPQIVNPQTVSEANTVEGSTGKAQLVATGGSANWTVDGEVTLVSPEATIKVTIVRAGCWDAGSYTCNLQYYSDVSNIERASATASAYLSVEPSDLTVNVTPSLDTVKVKEGIRINITCSANVGSIRKEMYTIEWVWEYRDTSTGAKTWKKYDGNSTDISTPLANQKEGCFERRFTKLTRVIVREDSMRDYRCFLRRTRSKTEHADFQEKAKPVTIPNFLAKAPNTLGKLGIVGIMFGVAAIVCASGLGCFFYARRRKRMALKEIEVAKKRMDIEEKRKSLATVVEKRKGLFTGGGVKTDDKADQLLRRLSKGNLDSQAPKITMDPVSASFASSAVEESTFTEDSSVVESSAVESTTDAASELSSVINKLG